MTTYINRLSSMTKMLTIAIALLVAGGTIQNAAAQKFSHRQAGNKFTQQQNNEAAESKFTAARDLIDDAQWIKAETQFAQYVAAYPQEKNADAAMYWMAYAQYKLRKFDQSKQTIDKLLKAYEKTAWKEDAETLLAQLPGAAVKIDPVNVEPTIAPGTPVAPVAPVAIAVPGAVIYTPAPGAPVALGQDPIEPQVRAEMQQRIAEAQARAQERTREAQDRVREKIAEAQAKWKDKNFVDFDYDFDFDFDFDYDSGNWGVGKGIGKGKGSAGDDDPCELKVVVLQALIENDPQRGISVATDWVKTGSTQTPTCRRAAVRLLARHGGKASIPTILGVAQNDPDPKVRLTAISSLGATNDDSVINPLRDFALNATDNQVAEAAVYALSQNTSAQAANVLADIALSNKPVSLRRAA
ncbi:MAG TPA: HEAT repeat domain-containing protein, partial [Pyrinomonadaceae bacterium]|nr:HEAT repeat domain-containing protein [Pyrinomonadaceae bacterium]